MIRRVLNWLASNWGTLLLSLLLALAVWIVASLEGNPFIEQDLSAPVAINVVGLEEGYIITNDFPDTTRVRINAQQETWGFLSADDLFITADLSGLGAGAHQVRLKAEMAEGQQARVAAMNPTHIRIVLEERAVREMPVQVEFDGEIPSGFLMGEYNIDPELVTVEGARSQVQLITEVRATIPIGGDQRSEIRTTAVLEPLDKDGEVIGDVTITPNTVDVTVPITQEADFIEVRIIPLPTGQLPPHYYLSSIVVTPSQIGLRGDPDLIAELPQYINTDPIDITNRTEDFTQQVDLNLPLGVSVEGPTTVDVRVSIAVQEGNRQIQFVPINEVGLENGLKIEFSPQTVDLILFGPMPLLNSLTTLTDVRVTIDLTGLGVGVHQIEPDVSIIGTEIEVQSVFPALIEVEITRDN